MAGKSKFILSIFIIFLFFSLSGCSIYNRFLERSSVNFVTYTDENIERIRVGYAETIDVFEITRTGYTFDGWYIDESFTDEFDESTPITEDVTLYAKWIPNTYLITFVIDTNEQTIPMTYDTPLDLSTVTKTGFELAGLYTDPNLSSRFNSQTVPAQDTILYTSWKRSSYAVEYKLPDGTVLDQQTLLFEDAIPLDPIERLGYAFQGWYADTNLQVPFNKVTMPATHLELYGAYTPLPFDITFETGEGSTISLLTVNYGDPIVLEDPYYPGYIFVGWYLDSDLSVPFVYETMPAEDFTLYARYRPTTYTLTVYPENGETPYEISYGYETEIQELDIPDKTGFSFAGWYEDPTLITIFSHDVMPDSNISAYASWTRNSYTLTLISNPHPPLESKLIPYEGSIELQTLSLTGYTFEGWFIDDQFEIPFSMQTMPAADLVLYSKFTLNEYSITIEANNDDTLTIFTLPYNSPIPDLEAPQKTGFTFIGWFIDVTLTIPFTHLTMPASDVFIYAKWSRNTYQLIFDTGLHPPVDTQSVLFDMAVSPPILTLEGYAFVGWYEDAGYQYPYSGQTMPASDLTLFAKFIINTYTLTVYENNDTLPYHFEFDYQENIEELMNPKKTGHTFTGWFTDDALTIPFTHITMPSSDIFIYAKWSRNSYQLIFDTGLHPPVETQSLLFEMTVSPPVLTLEGYTFVGWYEDSDGQHPYLGQTMPAFDLTLYAKFRINTYTLTLTENNGTPAYHFEFDYQETIEGLNDPTRTGYTFTGWFIDEEETLVFDHVIMPAEDLQIYASWSINTYRLSFDTSVSEPLQDLMLLYGSSLSLPDLSVQGYQFVGWYEDIDHSISFAHDTMPASDITAYASFVPNQHMLTIYVPETFLESAAGLEFTLLLTQDGKLFASGKNNTGQLGDGTYENRFQAVETTQLFGLSAYESLSHISAGWAHGYALSSEGRLFSWGNNLYGQLGNGSTVSIHTPTDITSMFDLMPDEIIIDVTSGYYHGLALTSLGRVFTWGINYKHELGNGSTVPSTIPIDITENITVEDDDIITDITASAHHNFVSSSHGHVYAWGNNDHGQLGILPSSLQGVPIRVDTTFGLNVNEVIAGVATGNEHTLVLTSTSRVIAFGGNIDGQLGIGVVSQDMIPRDISPLLLLLENEFVISVFAGGNSSAYVTSLGRLFVFGDNSEGQLGVASNLDILTPYDLSMNLELSSIEYLQSITFGNSHGIILTTVGRILTCGDNTNGQLSSSDSNVLRIPIIHRLHATYDVAFATDITMLFPSQPGFNYEQAFLDPLLSSILNETSMPDMNLILYLVYGIDE
ncbi:MAG: InlB B-repeat-containing protein [Acholeplasmataceae bacterium]|nr:InlB B-repeat-containing protein [Acholeplasmataceae bacterium]